MGEILGQRSSRVSARNLTIVVPAYNEERHIAATLDAVVRAASSNLDAFEIIVVDDGSSDSTGRIADEAAQLDSRIQVVHQPHNRGVGAAYVLGLANAQYDAITVVPGDNVFSEATLNDVFAAVGSAPLIISYRANMEVRTPLRRLLSVGCTWAMRIITGRWIRDAHSMFVFPVALARQIKVQPGYGYHIESLGHLLLAAPGYRQIPATLNPRPDSNSGVMRFSVVALLVMTMLWLGLRRVGSMISPRRDDGENSRPAALGRASFIIKAAITLLLLVFIVSKIDLGDVATHFLALSPVVVALLVAIAIGQMFLLAYRWCLVSRLLAVALPFREAIRCVLASQFFSQSLPASVGGDALRVWWLGRIGFPFAQATQNVLLDRLAGFLSLLIVNLPAVPLLVWMVGRPQPAAWLGAALLSCFILIVAACSRPARRLALYLLQAWSGHPRVAGILYWGMVLQRAIGRLFLLRQGGIVLLWGLLIHLLTILLCFLIARDVAIPVTFAGLFAVVPGVLLISYLPISIGGWGVREGGMAVGLGLLGIPPAEAVFVGLALGILGLAAAGVGAMVWLVTPMPVSLAGQRR